MFTLKWKKESNLAECRTVIWRENETDRICFSSIPTYTMGIYHLQEEIHQKMDTARANFFWHGPHQKRKYHMAKWRVMASKKRLGGLDSQTLE
jgi:hypothetical protein